MEYEKRSTKFINDIPMQVNKHAYPNKAKTVHFIIC